MAELPTRFYCNNCQEELRACSIKCCKCVDFDLCLLCFTSGAEIGTHKRDHDYLITDNSLYSVGGNSRWSTSDEYALLDAVESYGFGNWEAVSTHVGTKTKEEVKEHYTRFYVEGNVGKSTTPEKPSFRVFDHTCPDEGPLSPSLTSDFVPVELTILEQHEFGYMPYRDDFERESDNDAEKIISHLTVNPEDDDLDIALKNEHVDIYTRRLRERLRKKKIARDYGLITSVISSQKQQKKDKDKEKDVAKKKPSKAESDFMEKLQPFAQFIPLSEVEELYANTLKEKQLRTRIRELVRYRRNGLTNLDEVDRFEELRARNEKRKENKKKLIEKCKKLQSANVKKIPEPMEEVKKEEQKKEEQPKKEEPKKEEPIEEVEEEFHRLRSSNGFKYLSDRERKLCNSMRMKPARYITLKGLIIKDHSLKRQGIPSKTKYPSNLDKSHRKRIVNF